MPSKASRILDDTLVYYIIGDNGASGEGGPEGTLNEYVTLNAVSPEIRALMTLEYEVAHLDDFGTPAAYNLYAVGWAHAMDTPYQWTKQVASHWGGTRKAPSSTGQRASAPAARCVASSST